MKIDTLGIEKLKRGLSLMAMAISSSNTQTVANVLCLDLSAAAFQNKRYKPAHLEVKKMLPPVHEIDIEVELVDSTNVAE